MKNSKIKPPSNKLIYSNDSNLVLKQSLSTSTCGLSSINEVEVVPIKQKQDQIVQSQTLGNDVNRKTHGQVTEEVDKVLLDKYMIHKLDREQFIQYASLMEQARSNLINIISASPIALRILAEQYLQAIQQGYDQSEMFSLSYAKQHKEVVQKDEIVQVNAKQFGYELD